MIPREYWRQMYEELKCIDWDHHRTDEDIAREREHKRLAAEYDAAIKRNRKTKKKSVSATRYKDKNKYAEYQRQWRKEHREQLAAYNREWRRRKAEKQE